MQSLHITLLCLLLGLFIYSCKKDNDDPAIRVRGTEGEWTQSTWSGGGDSYSPRNYFYTFDVIANQPTSLTVTSSAIDIGLYVYDQNGTAVGYGSSYGRNQNVSFKPVNTGKYKVMVASRDRNAVGKFVLQGQGLNSDFTPVTFSKVELLSQEFTQDGGGGTGFSPKNQLYTFEITGNNQPLDIDVVSPDRDVWIRLFDQNGQEVPVYQNGRRPYFVFDSRSKNVATGTYRLWVGTQQRDAIAKTSVQIVGNVKNLQRISFQRATMSGSYKADQTNNYQFTVTEDNSPVDLAINSPVGASAISIYGPSGTRIDYILSNGIAYDFLTLDKGTYRVAVVPYYSTSNGNYLLTLYGNVADFKKQ